MHIHTQIHLRAITFSGYLISLCSSLFFCAIAVVVVASIDSCALSLSPVLFGTLNFQANIYRSTSLIPDLSLIKTQIINSVIFFCRAFFFLSTIRVYVSLSLSRRTCCVPSSPEQHCTNKKKTRKHLAIAIYILHVFGVLCSHRCFFLLLVRFSSCDFSAQTISSGTRRACERRKKTAQPSTSNLCTR